MVGELRVKVLVNSLLSYLHHTMYSLEVRYSRSSSLLLVTVVEARDLAASSDTHVQVRLLNMWRDTSSKSSIQLQCSLLSLAL